MVNTYTYTMSFTLDKEGNPVICDNMDKPREHYTK